LEQLQTIIFCHLGDRKHESSKLTQLLRKIVYFHLITKKPNIECKKNLKKKLMLRKRRGRPPTVSTEPVSKPSVAAVAESKTNRVKGMLNAVSVCFLQECARVLASSGSAIRARMQRACDEERDCLEVGGESEWEEEEEVDEEEDTDEEWERVMEEEEGEVSQIVQEAQGTDTDEPDCTDFY
jgi:hypothetical protein